MSGEENSSDAEKHSPSRADGSGRADAAAAAAAAAPSTSSSQPVKKQRQLPQWLNHFNSHDLKILFRCCVAAWVAIILTFIHPVLTTIGIATFFAALVVFIVPPASILFVYLLGALSLLFGMCLAWAWGLLAMKAALAARPEADTQAKLETLKRMAGMRAKQTGQSPTWEAQVLVHDGFMLDARVTTVFFVMGCFFIYFLARLRISNPKFTLTQVFGTIVTDIFILFGPSLPSFTASLGAILVKPGAIGIGIGTACCLLFFPQSTSFTVLYKLEKLLLMGRVSLDTTRKRFDDQKLEVSSLRAARANMVGLWKAMQPDLAFLPLDFSRGRWSAEDVKSLQDPIRKAMMKSLSLLDFHIGRIAASDEADALRTHKEKRRTAPKVNSQGEVDHGIGHHQLQESAGLIDALENPEHGVMRQRTVAALKETTADALDACHNTFSLVARSLRTVNYCRWIRRPSQQQYEELREELEAQIASLHATRALCLTNTTEAVLNTHDGLFDEHGQLMSNSIVNPASLQGIIISMVFEEHILGVAESLQALLKHVARLVETRTESRIWLPNRLQYAFSWVLNGKTSIPVSGTTSQPSTDPDSLKDPESFQQQAEEASRRLRISRVHYGSASHRSRLNRAIVGTFRWLTNPTGMYALRMVVVTVATSIPAVVPHSAGFFYREKGIWGVITAQTTLLPYMADFVFSVFSRGVGTVLGGLIGLVAWYIGSGSGPGNPYGLGAATAVCTVFLMWLRIWLPPAFSAASIMTCATFALIIGFSYDQHHIQQYGLPGLGYVAFWKRLVTVLLGFVAAIVVQIFPRPPSATKHACRTLANTMRTLSDHYALLLSHWSHTEQDSPLGAVAERITLEVAESLLSLHGAIAMLKVEVSFGPFDQATLRKANVQCQYLNQCLGRLLHLTSSLPTHFQARLSQIAGIQDDRVVGDIMAVLNIIEQSLLTGSPLPERLPTPLVRKFYDSWHAQHRDAMMSKDLVRSEAYRRYCVAVSSYLKFLSTIDNLVLVLKEGLGESHLLYDWEDV